VVTENISEHPDTRKRTITVQNGHDAVGRCTLPAIKALTRELRSETVTSRVKAAWRSRNHPKTAAGAAVGGVNSVDQATLQVSEPGGGGSGVSGVAAFNSGDDSDDGGSGGGGSAGVDAAEPVEDADTSFSPPSELHARGDESRAGGDESCAGGKASPRNLLLAGRVIHIACPFPASERTIVDDAADADGGGAVAHAALQVICSNPDAIARAIYSSLETLRPSI
jgi:hypothetical protein